MVVVVTFGSLYESLGVKIVIRIKRTNIAVQIKSITTSCTSIMKQTIIPIIPMIKTVIQIVVMINERSDIIHLLSHDTKLE